MIRRRLKHALDWRFAAVIGRLDALTARVANLDAGLQATGHQLEELSREISQLVALNARLPGVAEDVSISRAAIEQRIQPVLRAIVDEEAANRRRLFALRETASYKRAYAESDPLVSIVVPTHTATQALFERALPSVLAQTHRNLEVLVVGDAVSADVGCAIAALDDDRIRFANLTQRLVSHPEPRRHWLGGSTMARNEAARHARGQWTVHFDHDDYLRPYAISSLLELARDSGAEVAYGGFEHHRPDGSAARYLRFPPERERFAWPTALVHGGLRFFERELVASDLELPGDIYMLVRMLRAGVRFAMLNEIVLDYYASALWGSARTETSPSVLVSLTHRSPVAHRHSP